MKKYRYISILFLCNFLLISNFASGQQVIAKNEPLLNSYDNSAREYTKLQIDSVVSFFYQRKIGDITVEKDFIRYQFNLNSKRLIEDSVHWRTDLPDSVNLYLLKEEAEALVRGEVQFSKLYYISEYSDVFPISPVPDNPCWVINSIDSNLYLVTILDAVTGEELGLGVPPPYEGFSMHGPDWGACPQAAIWYDWANNAKNWFNTMGYNTERVGNASDAKVQSHIQSDETAMFYELDHGISTEYHNQCDSDITAGEIETWIGNYSSMVFAFIGSCGGMCSVGDNNFSYEFRKGSTSGTVTVGYCDMSTAKCTDCWNNSIAWQTSLFDEMNSGSTVQAAFNQANLDYPVCAGANNCTRFAGDASLTVVPVVTRSLCGNIYNGSGGPLNQNARRHYIRCDIYSSAGQTLTIGPGADLIFLNDSELTANGTIEADGSTGQIRLVSESNESNGMEFTGELEMRSGGEIKIYDN